MMQLGRIWCSSVATTMWCASALVWCTSPLLAVVPTVDMGAKPSFGLFQPRVSVSVLDQDGQTLGPDASSFVLDTAASGVVVYAPASTQLKAAGYQTVGTYDEFGVSGSETFDVSAPYQLNFVASDGRVNSLYDVRLLSSDGQVDPTGTMGIHGIIGMPAMEGRVTTLDNRTTDGELTLSMGVAFSDTLSPSTTQRFTVPLQVLDFPATGTGPLPTFRPLPTLAVESQVGSQLRTDRLILDSGAQITIISSEMAFDLGLDANGDGDLLDDATTTVPIGGVGGTISAPVLVVDEMRIPTEQGFSLVWRDAQVIVQDIDPSIAGVLAADFMTGDGGIDFGLLSGNGLGGLGDLLGGDLGSLLGGGGLGSLEDLLSGLGGLGGLGDIGGLLDGLLGGFGDLGGLFGDLGLGAAGGVAGADPLDDLLGGLGDLGGLGGLLGGLGGIDGSNPFAAFPLESKFDRIHFDFRNFPNGDGLLVFDLNPTVSSEILNGDGVFDVRDIDDLNAAIGTDVTSFDLNADGVVSSADRDVLIRDVFGTISGDIDLDHDVDFQDFLVFSSAFGGNSAGWGSGDFDGDGEIGFPDFLLLSASFGQAPGSVAVVPEPGYAFPLAMAFGFLVLRQPRNSVRRLA